MVRPGFIGYHRMWRLAPCLLALALPTCSSASRPGDRHTPPPPQGIDSPASKPAFRTAPWPLRNATSAVSEGKIQTAAGLMEGFLERTGLVDDRPPRRYLWTDAFAVCNLLGLARATGEARYLGLARRLVDQVHRTLGRHRGDDPRRGWLSGLSETEGETRPTRGGLRIGKERSERGPGQRFDERLEWERDGQYFHYLTKWMQALDQMSRATGEPRYNQWARELAAVAVAAFSYRPAEGGPQRMYWKMSIDLSRPLVPSMGQHDPLDGLVTLNQLRATAARLQPPAAGPDLDAEIRGFAAMLDGVELASADPLGIGGLLIDAYRVWQLSRRGRMADTGLLPRLLEAALAGLRVYARSGELQAPAEYRLAFRELGLAIGLQAVQRLGSEADAGHGRLDPRTRARLTELLGFAEMGEAIEAFWRRPEHQRGGAWSKHRDINEVMLATRLAPDGLLTLPALD